MDRDTQLIAYLDAKFEGIDVKFDGIDRRFEEMGGQIDRRFEETREQIEKNREQILKNREGIEKNREGIEKNREGIRGAYVLIEKVRSEVEVVAEGHSLQVEKLDRIHEEIREERLVDRAESRAAYRRLCQRVERLEAAG